MVARGATRRWCQALHSCRGRALDARQRGTGADRRRRRGRQSEQHALSQRGRRVAAREQPEGP